MSRCHWNDIACCFFNDKKPHYYVDGTRTRTWRLLMMCRFIGLMENAFDRNELVCACVCAESWINFQSGPFFSELFSSLDIILINNPLWWVFAKRFACNLMWNVFLKLQITEKSYFERSWQPLKFIKHLLPWKQI